MSWMPRFSMIFLPRVQVPSPILFILVFLLFGLSGCGSDEKKEIDLGKRVEAEGVSDLFGSDDPDALYFGFDLRGSLQEDAKQYLPFLDYLEKATGLTFELRFTPQNSTIVDELCQGLVQFGAIGADTYLAAHAKCGAVPLVRGLNAAGRAEYQSLIIVAKDSPIKSLDELAGKTFAFGSKTSTQGHLIPRIVLAENGLKLSDLAGYEFTGSHQECANAVAAGRFDAGGMQDILGRRLVDQGFIRILHTSEFFPSSGIAANKDVPPDVVATVKKALLEFKPAGEHADGLYNWDRTEMALGFGDAQDEDYADLRKWNIKFGLLDDSEMEQVK